MTPQKTWEKFKELFPDFALKVIEYKSINGDYDSIRIIKQDFTSYIFTYPRSGHYTLTCEGGFHK